MKVVTILLALVATVQAELTATLQTTRGNVAIALQYDKAPQAVANFITLAQGTRTRLHEATGAVTNAPLFVGEKFFRVLNDTGFRIAQTGSGNGTNSGGPGYTFKDEFHASLTHVPYVLSMANSGPNSNGSQIFLTGSDSIPSLNNVHTVFGLITDLPSRAVIDSIMAAGNDATTITGVTFNRSSPGALAFNEFAQNLPTILRAGGSLAVQPGVSSVWNFNPTMISGDVLRARRSTTLASGSWAAIDPSDFHVGIGPVGVNFVLPSVTLDTATSTKAFYHLAVARHPGSVTPSSFANRVLYFLIGNRLFGYQFNGTATGGVALYEVGTFSQNFTFSVLSFDSSAHSTSVILQNIGLPYEPQYLRVRVGWDSADNVEIFGHHSTDYYNFSAGDFLLYSRGAASVTR
jgi:peptidyl-prolyl cis-trans isomerase A (cyclophilin A)